MAFGEERSSDIHMMNSEYMQARVCKGLGEQIRRKNEGESRNSGYISHFWSAAIRSKMVAYPETSNRNSLLRKAVSATTEHPRFLSSRSAGRQPGRAGRLMLERIGNRRYCGLSVWEVNFQTSSFAGSGMVQSGRVCEGPAGSGDEFQAGLASGALGPAENDY